MTVLLRQKGACFPYLVLQNWMFLPLLITGLSLSHYHCHRMRRLTIELQALFLAQTALEGLPFVNDRIDWVPLPDVTWSLDYEARPLEPRFIVVTAKIKTPLGSIISMSRLYSQLTEISEIMVSRSASVSHLT